MLIPDESEDLLAELAAPLDRRQRIAFEAAARAALAACGLRGRVQGSSPAPAQLLGPAGRPSCEYGRAPLS